MSPVIQGFRGAPPTLVAATAIRCSIAPTKELDK